MLVFHYILLFNNTALILPVLRIGEGGGYVGNPHNIKEHKMHKMPPYLVFNSTRSSMYPEIYVSLGFRRGSQNRNHFMKARQDDGYIIPQEKKRLKKSTRTLSVQLMLVILQQYVTTK